MDQLALLEKDAAYCELLLAHRKLQAIFAEMAIRVAGEDLARVRGEILKLQTTTPEVPA